MYERLHQLAIYSMQLHFLQKNDLDNANERVYIRLSPLNGTLNPQEGQHVGHSVVGH